MKNKFSKTIIIVIPWFGEMAGGAEFLAKTLAMQFNSFGIKCLIFTTCSRSQHHNWWQDYYKEGRYIYDGLEVYRFSTNKNQIKYEASVIKTINNQQLTEEEKANFFICGINSNNLIKSIKKFVYNDNYEIIALPYFQGLTHSIINSYKNRISMIPCFHNEPQLYWNDSKTLIKNAKHIFFNSPEEKILVYNTYGNCFNNIISNSPVAGLGIDIHKPIYKILSNIPKKYFIYVGKKDEGKNIKILCDWFIEYKKHNKNNIKLLFVGGGNPNLIPKHNYFIDYGFVDIITKNSLIKKSLGLINLSQNESLSLVIMEAWLNSVPVVVANKCNVTKNLALKANGGLYADNKFEFEIILNYLSSNKNESLMLAKNGFDYIKKRYSIKRILNIYINKLMQ